MARVCVFCGSRESEPVFQDAAKRLGRRIAERKLGLVYGGAARGLMGILADATLAAGGEVTGVIPHSVFRSEIAHTGLTKLHVVETMHERKALMNKESDAFIAMPGGLGTFDELFEILTWKMIGIHDKPIGIFDVDGYFAPLRSIIDNAIARGFLDEAPIRVWSSDADTVLDALSEGST
jgi:hypothetical protein